MSTKDPEFHPWAPGISSEIPSRLMPSVTIYRSENVNVSYASAKADADFCGLSANDMIEFTCDRLIVHELLIRVTSSLSVPDGPNYEELGLNLRGMTARLLEQIIAPHGPQICQDFEKLRGKAEALLIQILDQDLFVLKSAPEKRRIWPFGRTRVVTLVAEPAEVMALQKWKVVTEDEGGLERACYQSLIFIIEALLRNRGRLMADRTMIVQFALRRVLNDFGSRQIGAWLEPLVAQGAQSLGYRLLPAQKKPLFMNVKGASAAGKSTIRPEQRELAKRLSVPWEDFALISPDYWRKFLLDYASMGPDYKFAAMLTGQELEIIDKKLDLLMEERAAAQNIPHLLIDRFRFDSFDVANDQGRKSQLLTRFGHTVYLSFIITPPAETVVRAWNRGLKTGRYKAVEDLLYHNIEAYRGIPNLFFSTIASTTKTIHFEFLDNNVAFGQKPKTVAYGWNHSMAILDLISLTNVDRFKNVNIDALSPDEVLIDPRAPAFGFVKSCLDNIEEVTLAVSQGGFSRIYGQYSGGAWVYKDAAALACLEPESALFSCLQAMGWVEALPEFKATPTFLPKEEDQRHTLGSWA
ncbi:MAG: hypothetical protein ACI9O0_000839 [Paracoccaceae bacterium]|jgi:hypothetical protein